MMGLFLNADSGEAIRAGVEFLRIVSPLYFMISIKLMTDGVIRGSGAMVYFVLATIPDLILRIAFAYLLTPRFGSTGIWDGLALRLVRRLRAHHPVLPSDCYGKIQDSAVRLRLNSPDSVNIL